MDFMTAVSTCFSKYVDFSGRATRPEFWWFALFTFAVSAVLQVVLGAIIGHGFASVLANLFSLAVLLPSLAVGARRLHDGDRSAWWLLIVLVPVIGWFVLLYFYVQPGTPGPNQYGA